MDFRPLLTRSQCRFAPRSIAKGLIAATTGLVDGKPNESPGPRAPGFDGYEPRESCTLHAALFLIRLILPSLNDARLPQFNQARDPRSSLVIVPSKFGQEVYRVLPGTAYSTGRLAPWQATILRKFTSDYSQDFIWSSPPPRRQQRQPIGCYNTINTYRLMHQSAASKASKASTN
jgi:hypothetical protein